MLLSWRFLICALVSASLVSCQSSHRQKRDPSKASKTLGLDEEGGEADTEVLETPMPTNEPSPEELDTELDEFIAKGVVCRELPDGSWSWDQPNASKFNPFKNMWEGRCGHTACANVAKNLCDKILSPADKELIKACGDLTPGAGKGKIKDSLNRFCGEVKGKPVVWEDINSKTNPNATPQDILADCKLPAVALVAWENQIHKLHYVTIVGLELKLDAFGNTMKDQNGNPIVDKVVINHWGEQQTLSYDTFLKYWDFVWPATTAKYNIICRPVEPTPATPTPSPSPSPTPSESPTEEPSYSPTPEPTYSQTPEPSYSPTPEPTYSQTPEPSYSPTPEPTYSQTPEPSYSPTPEPTYSQTPEPSYSPTPEPTYSQTPEPTYYYTPEPSDSPTEYP